MNDAKPAQNLFKQFKIRPKFIRRFLGLWCNKKSCDFGGSRFSFESAEQNVRFNRDSKADRPSDKPPPLPCESCPLTNRVVVKYLPTFHPTLRLHLEKASLYRVYIQGRYTLTNSWLYQNLFSLKRGITLRAVQVKSGSLAGQWLTSDLTRLRSQIRCCHQDFLADQQHQPSRSHFSVTDFALSLLNYSRARWEHRSDRNRRLIFVMLSDTVQLTRTANGIRSRDAEQCMRAFPLWKRASLHSHHTLPHSCLQPIQIEDVPVAFSGCESPSHRLISVLTLLID